MLGHHHCFSFWGLERKGDRREVGIEEAKEAFVRDTGGLASPQHSSRRGTYQRANQASMAPEARTHDPTHATGPHAETSVGCRTLEHAHARTRDSGGGGGEAMGQKRRDA